MGGPTRSGTGVILGNSSVPKSRTRIYLIDKASGSDIQNHSNNSKAPSP